MKAFTACLKSDVSTFWPLVLRCGHMRLGGVQFLSRKKLNYFQKLKCLNTCFTCMRSFWHNVDSQLLGRCPLDNFWARQRYVEGVKIYDQLLKIFLTTVMLNMWYDYEIILLQKGLNASHNNVYLMSKLCHRVNWNVTKRWLNAIHLPFSHLSRPPVNILLT